MQEFEADKVCGAIADFVDDLSNWYIRRNRRRFWRSQDASDTDKLAAYQTLHEVLVTLTKLIAPLVPFVAERMYQNLVRSWDKSAAESVHLCDYPEPNREEINTDLNLRTATAQTVVKMALKLREDNSLRVRQPLAELQYACDDPEAFAEAVASLSDVIQDELNVKTLTARENLDDLVHYNYKPNLKTLGPKYGKLLGTIKKHLPNVDAEKLAPLRKGESVTLNLEGEDITLEPDDVLAQVEQAADWVTAGERGIQIALSTTLTPELRAGRHGPRFRPASAATPQRSRPRNPRPHPGFTMPPTMRNWAPRSRNGRTTSAAKPWRTALSNRRMFPPRPSKGPWGI